MLSVGKSLVALQMDAGPEGRPGVSGNWIGMAGPGPGTRFTIAGNGDEALLSWMRWPSL